MATTGSLFVFFFGKKRFACPDRTGTLFKKKETARRLFMWACAATGRRQRECLDARHACKFFMRWIPPYLRAPPSLLVPDLCESMSSLFSPFVALGWASQLCRGGLARLQSQ
nr:hypothetical protein [Pandoravirus aubagnensis]